MATDTPAPSKPRTLGGFMLSATHIGGNVVGEIDDVIEIALGPLQPLAQALAVQTLAPLRLGREALVIADLVARGELEIPDTMRESMINLANKLEKLKAAAEPGVLTD